MANESTTSIHCWGALWRRWCGPCPEARDLSHLLYEWQRPALFNTRREARAWIRVRYGYLRKRPDLRRQPYCWRMPVPVRVTANYRWQKG